MFGGAQPVQTPTSNVEKVTELSDSNKKSNGRLSNKQDSPNSNKPRSVLDELETYWEEQDEEYRMQKKGIQSGAYIMQ